MVGIFSLARPELEPFTPSQIELVQTFADQAVIAIENARLFNEVKARTEDLSEALQQQTATADVLKVISRSAFDLRAVLDTLVEVRRRLCASTTAFISLHRDGDSSSWRKRGCTKNSRSCFERSPIQAGPQRRRRARYARRRCMHSRPFD